MTPRPARSWAATRPVLEGMALGLGIFAASAICVGSLYLRARAAQVDAVRNRLERLAQEAAATVDIELHGTLRRAGQQGAAEYERALAPLVVFHRSHPSLFYVYTLVMDGATPRFVLDTANRADLIPHEQPMKPSRLMDAYEDEDPELLEALRDGAVTSSPHPLTDEFGTFMSGFAPLRDARGATVGIAGVDMTLPDYLERLAGVRRAAGFSLGLAAAIAVGAGAGLTWFRRVGFARDRLWREAASALRKSESMLRGVMDNAAESICLLDLDGRPAWSNPAFDRVHGGSGGGERPRLAESVHPEDAGAVRTAIAEARRSGRSATFMFRVCRADAPERCFEAQISRLPDEEGAVAPLMNVARDVTERRAAERERDLAHVLLSQAQKLESVGRLAAGVAHEINTPTQFVADNMRFLRTSWSDTIILLDRALQLGTRAEAVPEMADAALAVRATAEEMDFSFLRAEIPQCIDQTYDGVQRIVSIVQAMKRFSHPGPTEKAPFDLNAAIETAMVVSRNEWKWVAESTLDLDPELDCVPCTGGEINQVLLNLIINAAQAIAEKTPPGSRKKGTIAIQTRRRAPWAEIRIRDTGGGIPPAVQPRIFEPFFTTKPVGTGTGQGLAITRSVIVDGHGGEVEFETTPGEGTCFIVRLPLEGGGAPAPKPAAMHGELAGAQRA